MNFRLGFTWFLLFFLSCKKDGEAKSSTIETSRRFVFNKEKATPEELEKGRDVYSAVCAACHMPEGEGDGRNFPPLASSDFLNADPQRSLESVLNGLDGKIKVNGKEYESFMPAQKLSDEEIAAALTYVYANWDNSGYRITASQVKQIRETK